MVHNTSNKIYQVLTYTMLILIGFLLLAPFLYMISISLLSDSSSNKMLFSLIPKEFNFENYFRIFTDSRMLLWLKNSFILVLFSIIGQMFVSSFVAYGFARLRAPGKKIIFSVLLGTMMIPGQITMIPQFMIFSKLHMVNTLLPIIIPNFFGGAYNVFLIRQFILGIPSSLEEAAKIDGLSYFGIYKKIVLPLIKPALAAIAIFTFNYNWGAFMEPLIYINDSDKMPLALGVRILQATENVGALPKWNVVMVASMLLTLPMIIIFFLGQKRVFEMNISVSGDASK